MVVKKYNGINVKYNCSHLEKNIIYKLSFPNGKVYIGQTINVLFKRISSHCEEKNKSINPYKYNALKKYQTINVDILFKSESLEELNNKEEYYIKKYKSNQKEYGYNLTAGGDSVSNKINRPIYLYDLNGKYVRQFKSVSEGERYLGIRIRLDTKQKTFGGYQIKDYKVDKIDKVTKNQVYKEIHQYDLNGNYIRSFNSIREAERFIGKGNIDLRSKTSRGYMWSRKKLNKLPEYKNDKARTIHQYDLNDNYINEFRTLREASKQFGFITMSMKSSRGYKWEYKIN